jgi:tetratricopeptide (TPR) repeat protein
MNRLLLAALMISAFILTGFRNPPGSAERFMEMGDQAQMERNPAKALDNYGRAIAMAPDKADFYLQRGFLLLKLERLDEALQDFGSFIALEPNNPSGYMTRGMAYDMSGKGREAALDFVKACSLGDKSGCNMSRPALKTEGE